MKEEPIEYRTAEVTIACPEGLPIIKYNKYALALSFQIYIYVLKCYYILHLYSPKTSLTYTSSQNETHFQISDFLHPC